VDQVFTRYNIDEQEKFKVVIKKLRGHALEWWEKYKYKRKKRGKSKITTWVKLRGKLMDTFAPTSYLHKCPFLSFEANDFNSSSKNLHFNKGSPMSACNSSCTSFFYLEKRNSNKDEEILGEKRSVLVDIPLVFDDCGDEETFELEAQRSELKQEEIVQEIEQSFTQEGCQEDNEVNLGITPGIEEFEQLLIQEVCPTELQAPELEPCGVIEEVEQLLTQEEFTLTPIHPAQTLAPKEDFSLPPLLLTRYDPFYHPPLTLFYVSLEMMPCDLIPQKLPYCERDPFLERLANPLSLRTNSKPPGEYDAYSHMHHFYLRSTSKKKSVKQERAWELSYFLLLCEFKDFRHHQEVKEVAKLCRKLVFMPEEVMPPSSRKFPVFVCTFGLAQVDPQLEAPHGVEV